MFCLPNGAKGGSTPLSYSKTVFGIYGIFDKISSRKSPQTLDAVGVQPTASILVQHDGGGEGSRTLSKRSELYHTMLNNTI